MICYPCGGQLRPLSHPPGQLSTWLRCPACNRWVTAAGMPLVQTPTEPPDGVLDHEPLCPDRHEEP